MAYYRVFLTDLAFYQRIVACYFACSGLRFPHPIGGVQCEIPSVYFGLPCY